MQENPEDVYYVDQLSVNNSCFSREYVLGDDTPQIRAASLIISQALQQPFFTEMRTNQQLGYVVWSYAHARDETHYVNFLIQSGVYPADELNQRADDFIATTPDIIGGLDAKTFQQLKDSAIEKLDKKPKSIQERSNKFKNYIFERKGDFEYDEKTKAALKAIDHSSVVDLLSEMVAKDSRRTATILMFADGHENNSEIQSSFKNMNEWKTSRVYR